MLHKVDTFKCKTVVEYKPELQAERIPQGLIVTYHSLLRVQVTLLVKESVAYLDNETNHPAV